MGSPNERILVEVLKQNWSHIRHMENGRMQFTYIYAVLLTAVLAIGPQCNSMDSRNSYQMFLALFFVMFSFLGYVLTSKIDLEIKNHVGKIRNIIKLQKLDNFMSLPQEYPGKIGRIIKSRYIFKIFYFIFFVFWLGLLSYMIFDSISIPVWAIPPITATSVLIAAEYQLNKESEEGEDR